MKPLLQLGQWVLAACLVLAPLHAAGQAAPPRDDFAIGQKDFAGLGKPVVLQMQKNLEDIYRDQQNWKRDFAQKARPLDDGVVGPVTLRWLQRYAVNFKFSRGLDEGKSMPFHMARMAAFAIKHPDELAILLSDPFDAWDAANPVLLRKEDYAVRRQAAEAPLLALVERYRASLVAAPPSATQSDGYYTWMLYQADLDLLGGKVDAGAVLAKFKDQPYESAESFKPALEAAFKGHTQISDQLWPTIRKNLRPFHGQLIDPAALAKMKQQGMSTGALEEVAAFGTVYLKSREEYDTYITGKIASGELTVTDDELALLAGTTSVFDNVHLDQTALDTIAKQLSGSIQYAGVPAPIVKMLGQMVEVDYPDVAIFHSAVKSKIAFGLGMCRLNAPVNNDYVAKLAISDAELAALQKQMEALDPKLGKQFPRITQLRNMSVRCDADEIRQADGIVNALYDPYLMPAVASAGRKPMPGAWRPITIEGAECGCAMDDMPGVVYGFYPYWWTPKNSQKVNFRPLNRMAYYGLKIDETGEFRWGSGVFDITDGSRVGNEFVHTAHQHNARVDWLIEKNDWGPAWTGLNADGRVAVFKRIRDNISTLLNAPLTYPAARIKGWTTFIGAPPRRGDGVTLSFPNYPRDPASTKLFNEFYKQLVDEMDKHKLWVNILVTQNTLESGKNGGQGAFGLANLIQLRQLREQRHPSEPTTRPGTQEKGGYLLVLLNEPSADAKKALRLDVENDTNLHGAARADFLRNMLPVLHFDDKNWQQLDDDIVYARDNFGGVGLWAPDFDNMAQPVKTASHSCLESQQIVYCLLADMRGESVASSVAGPIEAFACVHRWILQWIMLFLIAAGVLVIILFFTFCKVQNFIKEYFLWMQLLLVLPTLLVFILLLLYDPFMENLSNGNLPFFIAAAVIMIGVFVGYRFWRAQRQVPQRERGMPSREAIGFPIVVSQIDSANGGFQWLIKNRGSGYAIIKKVEILLDGNPVADARTAIASVMESENTVLWKSMPLVGQKLEAGKQLVGLSIPAGEAARAFEQRLKAHDLAVKITYSGANNEHWTSDGAGIMSVAGVG